MNTTATAQTDHAPEASAAASPEASAPSAALELFPSKWTDEGLCLAADCERIEIPDMPAKTGATIYLALAPQGTWRAGYSYHGAPSKPPEEEQLPDVLLAPHADRPEALRHAVLVLSGAFLKNKKAAKALNAFYTASAPIAAGVPDSAPDPASSAPGPSGAAAVLAVPAFAPLPKGRFAELPVSAIQPNPENHRKHFDSVAMQELLASLRQVGQLQPIAVRALSSEELGELPAVGEAAPAQRFEIILGERRWRAHKIGEIPTIDAKVYEGVTRRQAKAAALVENLQRAEINALEEAEGYADLIATENLTQDECARRVGRSRPAVANALRLLRLPEPVRELIRAAKLTPAHGHALAVWADRPLVMAAIAEIVVERGVSAGDLEEYNRSGGIPFQGDLERAGLLFVVTRWNKPGGWDREFPAEILHHADYVPRQGGEQFVCYNPPHWHEVVARENQKIETERAAAVKSKRSGPAKARPGETTAESGAPTTPKKQTLQDLPRGSYAVITNLADLAGLIPSAQVVQLPEWDDGADEDEDNDESDNEAGASRAPREVTVCLAPKFAQRVLAALEEARRADRVAKLPALLTRARALVKKWRKIGPRELVAITYLLMKADDSGDAVIVSMASIQHQAAKIPDIFLGQPSYGSAWDSNVPAPETAKTLSALQEGDPVAMLRVLVDYYLSALFYDERGCPVSDTFTPADYHFGSHGDFERATAFLRHLLAETELGLLEETAAGRKELSAQVKALPWYAEAYAEAEKTGEAGEVAA